MDDIVYRANELFIFRSAADGGAERSGCVELGKSDVTTWGQIVCGMQTRIYTMLEEVYHHHHQFICSKAINVLEVFQQRKSIMSALDNLYIICLKFLCRQRAFFCRQGVVPGRTDARVFTAARCQHLRLRVGGAVRRTRFCTICQKTDADFAENILHITN